MFTKIKDKLKNLKRIYIILGIVFLVVLIFEIIMLAVFNSIINKQVDQMAGKRWDDNDNGYQFTLLFDSDADVSEGFFEDFEHKYEISLKATIGQNEDMTEAIEHYYTSSFMMEGHMDLQTEHKSMKEVKTYGISGDYFIFHPLELIAGNYITNDYSDAILIDEDTAWNLFGSYDIIGQMIYVNNIPLFVTGIYKENDNKYENIAKGYESNANVSVNENGSKNDGSLTSLIYVPFNTLEKLGVSEKKISVYEFVSTAPSAYYVQGKLQDLMNSKTNHMAIISNTTRFDIENLYNVWKTRKERLMRNDKLYYPYYENVARVYEDILAWMVIYMFTGFIVLAVILFIFLHYFWVNRKIRMSVIKDKAERFAERIRETKKKETGKWKHF